MGEMVIVIGKGFPQVVMGRQGAHAGSGPMKEPRAGGKGCPGLGQYLLTQPKVRM